MTGKGSLNHNSRKFHAKNTDPNRTHWNVEYCNEDIKDVYHELFDEALKRYNDKQTRKDRKIDDYYEKIRSGKHEKLFHEVIIQIGDKDNMGSETVEGQLAAKVLDEYIRMIVQAKYLVDQRDGNGLYEMFSQSREYRNSMNDASSGPLKKEYTLYCDVIDETGAIATIATILSMNGISIKNIGIIHNREFEDGVLKIEFYGEEAQKSAAEQLKKRNYIIYER